MLAKFFVLHYNMLLLFKECAMADTIAAISTGNAPGGIGVIRISGDAAIETAAKVFAPADESQLTELKGCLLYTSPSPRD